jgi:hypothetical protein
MMAPAPWLVWLDAADVAAFQSARMRVMQHASVWYKSMNPVY